MYITNLIQNYHSSVTIPAAQYVGYVVTIKIVGPTTHTFTASESSGNLVCTVLVTGAGLYQYSITATKSVGDTVIDRVLIESAKITVGQDPTLITTGAELRGHAEKLLDAIEAVLEKRASSDQASYSIAGRSITKIPIAELLQLRDKYKTEVAENKAKASGKTARNISYIFR